MWITTRVYFEHWGVDDNDKKGDENDGDEKEDGNGDEGTCGGSKVIDWVSARLGFDLLASAAAASASQLRPDICHKHHKQRLCKITTMSSVHPSGLWSISQYCCS